MRIARMQRRYFLELGFKGLAAISSQQFRPQKTRASLVSKYSVGGIRFQNRQTRSGLDFVLNNGTTPDKPLIESTLGGVALLDFDNDGFLDIFFTNGARIPTLEKDDSSFFNRLYRNNRDGTFTDVTERAGLQGKGYCMGVAVADFDNDGRTDLYVTGVNRNVLYHNNGDGTFTDVTEHAAVSGVDENGRKLWSVGAAWFDYDNDGLLDLFVTNYLDWSLRTSKVCGNDGKRLSCSPSLYSGLPNLLYRNNGDGTFTEVSRQTGIAELIGKGMSVAVADFDDDNDGHKDLFTVNPHVSETADFYCRDHYRQPNALFRNLRNGRFENVTAQAGSALQVAAAHRGCAFGDLNNDGRIDSIVSAIGEPAKVLYNISSRENHWILIQLEGTKSNRDGIGSKIKITSESGEIQYNHATTAFGYASASDKRVHFGLGAARRIREIEIRWPSGHTQLLKDIAPDQILMVKEK